MVNRETNFNRRKVSKSKVIRDKKRSRSNMRNARRTTTTSPQPVETPSLTKKQLKRQKRLDQIYKQLEVTEVESRPNHKRNKKRSKKVNVDETDNNIMQD